LNGFGLPVAVTGGGDLAAFVVDGGGGVAFEFEEVEFGEDPFAEGFELEGAGVETVFAFGFGGGAEGGASELGGGVGDGGEGPSGIVGAGGGVGEGGGGWSGSGGEGAFVVAIDVAVSKLAFEGFEVVGPFALDPFEVGEAWAIGELVEHADRDEGDVVGAAEKSGVGGRPQGS
jgi:hypothetical protein